MIQKFNVGDIVEVTFRGRIIKAKINRASFMPDSEEYLEYQVQSDDTMAFVTEDKMFALPTPKDFKGVPSGDKSKT